MEGIRCKGCGRALPPGILRCPNKKCNTFNAGMGAPDFEQHTVLLSDAKLANVERVVTGLVDHIFGGGIANTSVNLLAGEPGAGKTTLCLQLADIFAALFAPKEVLYIANEQDASELRETALRLKLRNPELIRVVKGMGGMSFDLGELLTRFKPSLILLDSVTKWSGDDPALAVTICQRLKDYSVMLKAPSIVINQVTKGGDHAGLNQMQHAVDMCCLFEILHEDENEVASDKTLRHLWSTKNRFGPAPEEQFFGMTPEGLVPMVKEGSEYATGNDAEEETQTLEN